MRLEEVSKAVSAAIDSATERLDPNPHRWHLGASEVGHSCKRYIWLKFRWCFGETPSGRMQRLFARGHEEEHRIARWLELAGFKVEKYNFSKVRLYFNDILGEFKVSSDLDLGVAWVDVTHRPEYIKMAEALNVELPQFGFKSFGGHFAGAADGIVTFPEGVKALLECKTNKAGAEFNNLVKNGVRAEKRRHYSQFNVYANSLDLPYVLYINVCKNDDEIHCEVLETDKVEADMMHTRAQEIIASDAPPPRLSENPAYYECKMCEANAICFKREPAHKNCRSCVYAKPHDSGEWFCRGYDKIIPRNFVAKGCDNHQTINK